VELQSSNEELQSTNEELETSKEELQSTNEELSTVNDELQNRMDELSVSNDDLVNLLATVAPPVVMVSMDLRLRRMTESAEKLFGLSSEDLNRPISILRPFLPHVELERMCRAVIDRLVPVQQEVHAADGRKFELRLRPYRTTDHIIGGAVISLVPVPALGAPRGDSVLVSAIPVPAFVLDQDLRVVSANAAAVKTLANGESKLIGVVLEELGAGVLADTRLREAVERAFRDGVPFFDLTFDEQRRAHGARLPRSGEGGSQLLVLLQGRWGDGS
jgi:two-component system CheB/CheR fusion protein